VGWQEGCRAETLRAGGWRQGCLAGVSSRLAAWREGCRPAGCRAGRWGIRRCRDCPCCLRCQGAPGTGPGLARSGYWSRPGREQERSASRRARARGPSASRRARAPRLSGSPWLPAPDAPPRTGAARRTAQVPASPSPERTGPRPERGSAPTSCRRTRHRLPRTARAGRPPPRMRVPSMAHVRAVHGSCACFPCTHARACSCPRLPCARCQSMQTCSPQGRCAVPGASAWSVAHRRGQRRIQGDRRHWAE
jgi:hypothetical protein